MAEHAGLSHGITLDCDGEPSAKVMGEPIRSISTTMFWGPSGEKLKQDLCSRCWWEYSGLNMFYTSPILFAISIGLLLFMVFFPLILLFNFVNI